MLKKTTFAVVAALALAAPFAGSTDARAQSGVTLECWRDGNPKIFQPECPEQHRVLERSKQVDTKPAPRNRSDFDPDDLFEQMMLDSGGGAGGGGGR